MGTLFGMSEHPAHTTDQTNSSAEWRSYVLGSNVNRLRKRFKINKTTFCLPSRTRNKQLTAQDDRNGEDA